MKENGLIEFLASSLGGQMEWIKKATVETKSRLIRVSDLLFVLDSFKESDLSPHTKRLLEIQRDLTELEHRHLSSSLLYLEDIWEKTGSMHGQNVRRACTEEESEE